MSPGPRVAGRSKNFFEPEKTFFGLAVFLSDQISSGTIPTATNPWWTMVVHVDCPSSSRKNLPHH